MCVRGGQGGVDAQLSGVQDVVPEGLQVVGCVCVGGGGTDSGLVRRG